MAEAGACMACSADQFFAERDRDERERAPVPQSNIMSAS